MKKKTIALFLALALVVGCAIGGTVAWLTASTAPVVNTFTTAGIDIELTETFNTDTNNDGTNDKWQAQLIPGYTYAKNPVVTVKANSEKCYLFVKVTKSTNLDNYVAYTLLCTNDSTNWTPLTDVDGVYYTTVDASTSDQAYHLLQAGSYTVGSDNDAVTYTYTQDQVLVKPDLTKATMPTSNLELTFTAYASQFMKNATENFTAAEAWTNVNPGD